MSAVVTRGCWARDVRRKHGGSGVPHRILIITATWRCESFISSISAAQCIFSPASLESHHVWQLTRWIPVVLHNLFVQTVCKVCLTLVRLSRVEKLMVQAVGDGFWYIC